MKQKQLKKLNKELQQELKSLIIAHNLLTAEFKSDKRIHEINEQALTSCEKVNCILHDELKAEQDKYQILKQAIKDFGQ